ncbi:glutathione S-transferase family protein [Marinivivus vitaminiproducens]|uniref:glutathione S-transferase family protein n=1 Tax=Marinivivus vitaminiproducens TaxID=3035935 RepID=UPI0027A5ABBB|nr:glutathione S-transferase family protein [Geminicoccaceae bacterium SCSIO 64248]
MLKVWGRRNSYNVQKVMWLIGELDLPHEHIDAGGDFGGLDSPEFLAMNPYGRVPVIRDGALALWESQAILRYLAASYGRERFWPDDPRRGAPTDAWMDWSQTALQEDFLEGVFWGFYRTPPHRRDQAAVTGSIERCAGHMRLLDRLLADRDFIGGRDLGLADLCAGVALYRYFHLEIERPDVPHVTAWYDRLQARPAYRAHVMIPFDDLKGRLRN